MTETKTTPEALLKRQRDHSDKYKGQPEAQGGRDYPASDVERRAGTIRMAHYEGVIADAAAQADQEAVAQATEEYHLARLKVAQRQIDAEAKAEGK